MPSVQSVIPQSNIFIINDVTPKQAASAMQKRIDYFKTSQSTDMKIKENHFEWICERLEANTSHSGYRLYFDEIKEALVNNEFSAFDLHPKKLNAKKKEACDSIYYSDEYSPARELISKLSNAVHKPKLVRMISQIIQDNGAIDFKSCTTPQLTLLKTLLKLKIVVIY